MEQSLSRSASMERSLSRSASTLSQPPGGARAARCPALGTGLGGVHAVRVLLMIPYIFALLFSWVLADVRLDRSFFSSPVPFLSSDVGACVPNLVRALGVVATMLSHVLEAYRRRKLTLAGAPARPPPRAHHAAPHARAPCCASRSPAQAVGAPEPSPDGPKPRTGQSLGRAPSMLDAFHLVGRGCFSLRLNAGSMAVWDSFDCVETAVFALCCSGGYLVDLAHQTQTSSTQLSLP